MRLNARDVARLIDISAVQAWNGTAEIEELVHQAKEYRFIAVHVLPCWVPFLRELLSDAPDILIGAPVGFPSGAHRTEIKVAEAEMLVRDGVHEMDMVLNVGKLRSGDLRYCEEEIRAVVQAAGDVPVKVILEVHYLDRGTRSAGPARPASGQEPPSSRPQPAGPPAEPPWRWSSSSPRSSETP
jgi:deoxyribose-phosphate aldolase